MTCRDINELKPAAQEACRLFMKKCGEAGLKIFITETYRPQSRQDELYEQGRTKPGQIVTWTRNSRHTSRLAWDIACIGKELYDLNVLRKAGEIGKSLGITWGGDWTAPDRPHFEVTEKWEAPKEEAEMTQEEFNKFMENYLAEREKLPVSGWAEKEFEKAREVGITDGTMPRAFATREQVAAMILRGGRGNIFAELPFMTRNDIIK